MLKCAITGCAEPSALAAYDAWFGGGAIATDGVTVYFTLAPGLAEAGQVAKCSVKGCANAPAMIASTEAVGTASPGLAVDADSVYWTDGARGDVLKTAK